MGRPKGAKNKPKPPASSVASVLPPTASDSVVLEDSIANVPAVDPDPVSVDSIDPPPPSSPPPSELLFDEPPRKPKPSIFAPSIILEESSSDVDIESEVATVPSRATLPPVHKAVPRKASKPVKLPSKTNPIPRNRRGCKGS